MNEISQVPNKRLHLAKDAKAKCPWPPASRKPLGIVYTAQPPKCKKNAVIGRFWRKKTKRAARRRREELFQVVGVVFPQLARRGGTPHLLGGGRAVSASLPTTLRTLRTLREDDQPFTAVLCQTLAFSPGISLASSFVKAKHFLPRSFNDAPIR